MFFSFITSLLASSFLLMSDRAQFWDADKISSETEMIEGLEEEPVDFKEFKDKKVVLLVHGFNSSFNAALHRYHQINKQINVLDLYDTVIGYLWPGYESGLEYFAAKKNAEKLAERMRLHLIALSSSAATVDVIAHSMGNRLLLNALEYAEFPSQLKPVRYFYSLAAAVDDQSVEQQHTYFQSLQLCDGMYVFHSNRDDVLKFFYLLAERSQALGFEGEDNEKKEAKNLQFIDCTSFVDGHSDYFGATPLYQFIKNQHMKTTPDPSTAPNVRLLANGLVQPIVIE